MNNEFKKIAKQLGVAIPACLLSIGVANAETVKENEVSKSISAAVSEIGKSSLVNNEVVKFLTTDFAKNVDRVSPEHTDFHTDQGGNHADHHSDKSHANSHANTDAQTQYKTVRNPDGTTQKVPYCAPHSNNHTNRDPYSNHTNTGNPNHQDRHTNRDVKPNC